MSNHANVVRGTSLAALGTFKPRYDVLANMPGRVVKKIAVQPSKPHSNGFNPLQMAFVISPHREDQLHKQPYYGTSDWMAEAEAVLMRKWYPCKRCGSTGLVPATRWDRDRRQYITAADFCVCPAGRYERKVRT